MKTRRFPLYLATLCTLLLCINNLVVANTTRDFGLYVVHCNVIPASALDSDVATQFNIARSAQRGVLTLAIMEKARTDADGNTLDHSLGRSVQGQITAHWSGLNGKMGAIPVREVREQSAIYYIGEFDLPSTAIMTFDILVSVDANRPPYRFSFNRKFNPD